MMIRLPVPSLCRSATAPPLRATAPAGYNETPEYVDGVHPQLSSMSKCVADPVATVSVGQTVRLHAAYNSHGADPGAMGIMMAYIA